MNRPLMSPGQLAGRFDSWARGGFAASSPHGIFHYFANMEASAGHHVYCCHGEAIYEPGRHPGHAAFTIQRNDARKVWQAVVEDAPDLAA